LPPPRGRRPEPSAIAVQGVDHPMHDPDVLENLLGLNLQARERPDQRAQAELIAALGHGEIEPSALERALDRPSPMGLRQHHHGIAEPRSHGVAGCSVVVAVHLEARLECRVPPGGRVRAPKSP
jgi:hypothetical protein